MALRSGIIAGKTVIVVQVQESIDKALNTISTKLNKFSANVGRLGLELFGGGLVGGVLSKQITDTFKSFEDAILFLRTKVAATEVEFAALEERIRSLGRTTSFTAIEVADAATILAQGGLNAKETSNSLQATLDLARSGQVTLSQAGEILINTMRSFGIETSKAEEVASQFIAASRLGTLNIINLKESIKEVLGTVRNLNIDLPTTLALLTQMAERSLKGTKAGTSLNTALLNLASKTEVLRDKLGIILPKDINGDDFITFLDQLYERVNRLGNLQRTAILQQLFNIRGGRAITALDDLKKIIDLQKQIREAGNESRKSAILMDSGFGGAVRRATSAVESLTITLGKLFSKGLIPVLDLVPAVSASLEKLANANQNLLIPLVLVPPAMVGLGAGLLTLSFIGGKVSSVLGVLAVTIHKLTNIAIDGLNSQLVILSRTMGVFFNRVQRQGKGASLSKKGGIFQSIDEGLSALLLPPQKVKKGASAGKVRPSSFFGRVGSANAAKPIYSAFRLMGNALDKLTPSMTKVEFLVVSLFQRMNDLGKATGRLTGNLARMSSILASISSLGITSLLPGLSISPKGATNTFIAINNIIRQIKGLSKSGFTSLTTMFRAVTGAIRGFDAYRLAMVASAKVGGTMTKLSTFFGNLAKTASNNKSMQFLTTLGTILPRTMRLLSLGSFEKAFDIRRFSKLGTLFKGSGFGKVIGGLVDLFGKGFRLLISGFRNLPKLLDSSITGLFKFIKASGGFGMALLRTANGIRRFVFSIGGITTIIELLILFGPKIGFIRDAFARLGEGFGKAFSTISGTMQDLAPVFDLFRKSIGNIFSGEGELGVQGLIQGFTLLAEIVKSNLKIAFLQVVEAVAPLYDFLRQITLSLIEIVSLVGSLFGATFSNLGGSLQGLTGGGAGNLLGGLTDLLKSLFSPENLKTAFGFVGTVLIEMARIVNQTIQDIFLVINNLATFIQSSIASILKSISIGLQSTAESLAQGNLFSGMLSQIVQGISNASADAYSTLAPEVNANKNAADQINNSFKETNKELDGIMTGFLDRLTSIFSVNTEENAKAGIEAANAAKDAAKAEATKQANIQTQANSPLGKVGQFVANNLAGGVGKLAARGLGLLSRETKQFDFRQFGSSIAGIAKTASKNVDPKELIKQERKNLNQEASQLKQRIKIEKLSAGLFGTDDPNLIPGLQARLAENRKQLAALSAKPARGRRQIDPGSLRDIVSATVGTFRQTRGNLLRISGGKSVDQLQLDAMRQVVTNTGGPSDNVFTAIKDLSKRTEPFVFQ